MLEINHKTQYIALLRPIQNEDGFVLIAAIMTLLILVILGISSTTTTNVELQIAGNDMVNKQTFYASDAGTEVGARMVEATL
ncbi:MAG: PilX N-terminal domain-containing pilus assembly protein, partial [bacterium]